MSSPTPTSPTTPRTIGTDPLHHPPKPAGVTVEEFRRDAPRDGTGAGYDRVSARESEPEGAGGNGRGISELIKDLRDESLHLLRQEVNLAKTEVQEKASFFAKEGGKVAVGAAVLGLGALALISAVSFLLGGLIDHLVDDRLNASAANGLGFLIVGSIVALIGYSMYRAARARLEHESMTPERTIQSLKDDKQWLTNKSTETARDLKQQVTG